MNIFRKATGKLVGRNVPENNIELYLSTLPVGVYSIEDTDGIETALATVNRGRVRISPVASAVAVA